MPDWKVTATTVYCEAVRDEVTFIITEDGTAVCTGHERYYRSNGKSSACAGKTCEMLGKHLAEMLGEEAGASR